MKGDEKGMFVMCVYIVCFGKFIVDWRKFAFDLAASIGGISFAVFIAPNWYSFFWALLV